ncbi:MAG: NACHT domain-containing protein, partial [bacterium]|nr:NACHT domain-containing protein [bacterium]
GSPDIENKAVHLEDVFVSLRISESWRSDRRFEPGKMELERQLEGERYHLPEEVMNRAFKNYRLLLIIGGPGSGKTTLLKFYAMRCLDKNGHRYKQLGFPKVPLVLYFPLRELDFDEDDKPAPLTDSLARWSRRHLLNIPADLFQSLLQKQKTVVLLDGLDEVSSKDRRKNVCRWVKEMCTGLENARFVLTSRGTGYRKLDG